MPGSQKNQHSSRRLPNTEVIGLFPTPFMRVQGALADALTTALVQHFSAKAAQENNSSPNLVHTALLRPSDSPLLVDVAAAITPLLTDFGALLFGERLGWSLKEMWVNVMEAGGRQAMHNHANSFISGVVYLTQTDPAARTVFMRAPSGTEFSFKNDHEGIATGRTTPTSGSVRSRTRATSFCSRATSCMRSRRIRPAGALRWPSMRFRLGWIRGATRSHSVARNSAPAIRRLAFVLMLASGFAGLACEIVWTQQSALWLGHESAAVFAVTAGFFGGLAAGALFLGPRIDRSRAPGLWYAAAELVIALWSLTLALFFAPVTAWLLHAIGANPSPLWHWSIAFSGVFLLLLPATAAMGATLPAMERILGRMREDGTSIAGLYAFNTLGAMLGVLAAAFVLIPSFGLVRTAGFCAVLNLLCAAVALTRFGRGAPPAPVAHGATANRAMTLLAVTGLLGIGYEILVVRVLSQVAENTVYTFSILLAVYLVGTAIGAAVCHRWLSGRRVSQDAHDRLLLLVAGACMLGLVGLEWSETIKKWAPALFGASVSTAMASEILLALSAFLLPTITMGALFSYLATEARSAGVSFGQALGVNTLGAAIAPPLFGLVLVPAVGPKFAIVFIAAGYLALRSARTWLAPAQWVTVGAGVALAVWTPSLAIVDVPDGGRIVSYEEGTLGTVSIVEDAEGVASLHINNRQQEGSSATLFADSRQALLPILFHPTPHRVLFLGLGTSVTAWSAVRDASLDVDVVELLPEVIEASAYFTNDLRGEARGRELHAVAADARRFVRASAERYDVIVSDNFHPARAGSGALYTVEHFQAVRERLAAGGLFCQWLPVHQLDTATLRIVVRTFTSVYPRGWAVLATNSLDTPVLGLVALRDDAHLDPALIRQRMNEAADSLGLAQLGLEDEFALLGSFVAGPKSLARFGAEAPLNTDDRPLVAYRAPWVTYAPDSLPRDRLIALLHEFDVGPDELFAGPFDAEWASRLNAYWAARDRFIEAGRDVRPSADVRRMLDQVREPLLGVLRTSPDFRPAYDPLLRMATELSRTDVAGAREILMELEAVQPGRAEAGEVLRSLPASSR